MNAAKSFVRHQPHHTIPVLFMRHLADLVVHHIEFSQRRRRLKLHGAHESSDYSIGSFNDPCDASPIKVGERASRSKSTAATVAAMSPYLPLPNSTPSSLR